MKMNRFCLLTVLFFWNTFLFAQTDNSIQLRSGTFIPEGNITQHVIDSFYSIAGHSDGKTFAVIQFQSIPSQETRKLLSANGVELLDYIPNNAYTVTISGKPTAQILLRAHARSLFQLQPSQKMEHRLAAGAIPSWAKKVPGTVDVWISFPKTFSIAEVTENLDQLNFDILSTQMHNWRVLSLRISQNRLTQLAALPYVEYVQLAPQGDKLLNFTSMSGSRASLLNNSLANGGRALDGDGVVVGVGDNADVQTHIDFSGRLINRAAAPVTSGHGHHVTGTVGGAGNGIELYRGYAPKSTIVSQLFNGVILNASTYVDEYGMVLTNNSYGDNIECDYYGTYDLYSRMLDQMAFEHENLQNVFSAGNSGLASCYPFQPNYHTVLGGYQSAKNVITVGATSDSGSVSTFSSRGPVKDGRLKPEIVAVGQRVGSSWANNIYGHNNGTSMAGPAVTGGLALLYQRYRQLHAGADPENGLMKALLCNGAMDRGNAGPDYQYGFGWMNLLRSVEMMENGNYLLDNVANAASNDHVISVPANTSQLKVVLYWNDPAASPLSAHTLVNDLDLEVIDLSSNIHLPLINDTSNVNLSLASVNGVDRINNMEQVILNVPASGNYTIRIKGTAITQNPFQDYYVVYDFVPVQLKMVSPAGDEGISPSTNADDMIKVTWESTGFTSGTSTLEFSSDNGSSWSTLASGMDINRTLFSWFVPNIPTEEALLRITKDGTGESSVSNPFTIAGLPVVALAATQCEGYININWTAVAGATDYEVMMLRGEEMQSMAITTSTSHTFSGLSKDSVYWVTVRPRINGKPGRRARAISRIPSTGTCAGTISDNDLKIDAIVAPVAGRMFTSTQLGASDVISIRIKNLDDAPVASFDVKYAVNGGAFITENVAVPLAGGATYTHNFTTTFDFSAAGIYNLVVVVKNIVADPVTNNDTAFFQIKHLDNQPLDLTSYFTDDIESAPASTYEKDTVGLTGIDRYDFTRSTIYGRLRTYINSGMSYSGSKALTLDANRYYPTGNTNYLYGTFNLSGYNIISNDIRLDFQFNNHGQADHASNKVWIRGNDAAAWIEAYDLDDNQEDPGNYKRTSSIEVSDLLNANGQTLGTSFQVRWGQFGQIAATDKEHAGGYSFDDIRFYEVFNDIQMLSIDEPVTASCGLTNASTIQVSVRNSDNSAINNIPVRYRINGGSWVSETIASIAANATIQYTFTTTADLSAIGEYTIQSIVDLATDSFRENDTITSVIINSPVITSFPHLQDFESGEGSWYAEGKNVSWEYGTPVSNKINGAASGSGAWKTRLAGHYNDYELSYLYSPCYDISSMSNPTLSFSMAVDIEDCGTDMCDGAWVEYSADGITWTKLGSSGNGTNWYNNSTLELWSIQDFTRWHVATSTLPTGLTHLRLRFVMESDPAVNREGIAIDDIHIYDNTQGIYDGITLGAPISQVVSGNNQIDFTSGGQLVASIHPGNQDLGATDVQVYINENAVRHTAIQYYHDRNITIKPANTILADSVTIRFYFLEAEVDSLINATGCSGCTRPSSAYELGISKYSDPDDNFENGTIGDDNQGIWSFIPPGNIRFVPFDKGYYAEFKVMEFSEFWLNDGALSGSTPLPVKLMDFTAEKSGNNVLVNWMVGSETDVSHYEIELARGSAALQAGDFQKIGEVQSMGNTTTIRSYSFTDSEPDKFGTRYYRLKAVDNDGSFLYSQVRSVIFDEAVLWQVYPNPSNGLFNLVYQLNSSSILYARLIDSKGSVLRTIQLNGNGQVQKLAIDLAGFASGVYLLQINAGKKDLLFKLYKQ